MAGVVRRLTFVGAVAACAAAAITSAAAARPAPAGGISWPMGVRSLAYVQPLDEHETGTEVVPVGCDYESVGTVSGSPINNGKFFSIILTTCVVPGSCGPSFQFVLLGGSTGTLLKFERGEFCAKSAGSTVTLTFTGTYRIVQGLGAYVGAQGTGPASTTLTCTLSCTYSGSEGGPPEPGPYKKGTGNEPEHVLLCSPKLAPRSDGSLGIALQVPWADYAAWLADPTTHPEIPAGSIPAKYAEGIGLTCDNLPGYKDSGNKADEQGTVPDDQTGPLEGAIYPLWVKA